MRQHLRLFNGFTELDHQIDKFRKLRNDFAEANRPRRHAAPVPELTPLSISVV